MCETISSQCSIQLVFVCQLGASLTTGWLLFSLNAVSPTESVESVVTKQQKTPAQHIRQFGCLRRMNGKSEFVLKEFSNRCRRQDEKCPMLLCSGSISARLIIHSIATDHYLVLVSPLFFFFVDVLCLALIKCWF